MRYLVRCPDPRAALARLADAVGGCIDDDDVIIVSTTLERSPLYHQVKWSQAEGAPILVAPLDGDPKMKGVAPGAHACLDELRRDEETVA
jgi:hypothetical protein